MEGIIQDITQYVLPHWPFVTVVIQLWVIGHFMERSVFTRTRAKTPGRWQHFFYWGRESMELHPTFTGALLGLVWRDPEALGWKTVQSCSYFACAGFMSMFFWRLLTAYLKQKGVNVDEALLLPGESKVPSVPPEEKKP